MMNVNILIFWKFIYGNIWDRTLPGGQEDGKADEEGKDKGKEARDDDWGEGKMDWLGRGGGQ